MKNLPILALVAVLVSGSALASEGCAASGGSDDSSEPTADAGGDGETIDGAPVLSDGAVSDSGGHDSGGSDGGACVLTPPSNKCGIFPNCGCAGTTCDFIFDAGNPLPTGCTPSAGTAVGGAACAETTDCAEGLTCLFKKCHPFCGNPGDACGGIYSQCHNHAVTTGYNICGIACDLSSATSCGTLGCVGVSAGADATSECEPVGTGAQNATCASILDCAPGFNCETTSHQCKQTCKMSGGSCTTGTCTGFSSPLVVDGVTYGYCG